MPTRFNADFQPHVVVPGERAVLPGEPYEFSDEQIAAGITANWVVDNPRKGLSEEKAFKRRRNPKPEPTEATEATEDAGPPPAPESLPVDAGELKEN